MSTNAEVWRYGQFFYSLGAFTYVEVLFVFVSPSLKKPATELFASLEWLFYYIVGHRVVIHNKIVADVGD